MNQLVFKHVVSAQSLVEGGWGMRHAAAKIRTKNGVLGFGLGVSPRSKQHFDRFGRAASHRPYVVSQRSLIP